MQLALQSHLLAREPGTLHVILRAPLRRPIRRDIERHRRRNVLRGRLEEHRGTNGALPRGQARGLRALRIDQALIVHEQPEGALRLAEGGWVVDDLRAATRRTLSRRVVLQIQVPPVTRR